MADDSAYDIMAQFWLPGGQPIMGESMLQIDKADELINREYVASSDTDDYSNFFEVSNFSFTMTNEPTETGPRLSQGGGRPPVGSAAIQARAGTAAGVTAAAGGQAAPAPDPFKRWRSATTEEAKKLRWQLNFDGFKLTRLVDGGSPIFFNLCGTQTMFEKASLVKRVSRGGNRLPQAYLRFDFEEVTLKGIEWSDGDMVSENFTFICNKFRFKYRRQLSSGDLDSPVGPADWDRERDSPRKDDTTS